MSKPSMNDLRDQNSFYEFVKQRQKYNTPSGVKSTASINGSQTYAATTHTVADILQGNLNQVNPQDQLLVLNKALTDTLGSLYKDPENVHGFSTFSNSSPNFTVGSGSGTLGSGRLGSIVEESFVQSLPLKHANGALIWQGRGKASGEMHLPTSADKAEDVANHLQYDELPEGKKHPYYMDLEDGDGAGGVNPSIGSSGYVINWGGGNSVTPTSKPRDSYGYEDPSKPGSPSAFGYLDPLSEQFYISMAWPYSPGSAVNSFIRAGRSDIAEVAKNLRKNDHYKGKRLLVWSVETKRAVVVTPGDWGTQPYWSNGAVGRSSINGFYFGLSQDTHYALGTEHGAEVMVRWMPDNTPLGPFGEVKTPGNLGDVVDGLVGGDWPDDPSNLVSIGQGSHKLAAPAAASFSRVEQAFGRQITITGGYRSVAIQRANYEKDPSRFAAPGDSAHGEGRAVDVNLGAVGVGNQASDPKLWDRDATWKRLNTAFMAEGWCNFQYKNGTTKGRTSEPWHWSYQVCK